MRLRESVRALVLDSEDNVLLVHFNWDGLDLDGGSWADPGGGQSTCGGPTLLL